MIIDVSRYDRLIDWDVAHIQGGVDTVIVRAGLGVSGDAYALLNLQRAMDVGVDERAIYWAFNPTSDDDTDVQAEACVASYLGLKGLLSGVVISHGPGPSRVKLFIDVENNYAKLSVAEFRKRLLRFLFLVKQGTAEYVGIYTSASKWNTFVGWTSWAGTYPLWVAHYTTATKPLIPFGWTDWAIWQYSETGTVPGLLPGVDLNRRA